METRIDQGRERPSMGPRTKIAISIVIAVHVLSVFVGPYVFGGSVLAAKLYRPLSPWIEALRLGNGYRFFAPEPSPSHLIRYEAKKADGATVSGVIPDLDALRPRLHYHRHLVYTEFLSNLQAASAREPKGSEGRRVFEAFIESYARELGRRLGATEVSLWMQTHHIPTIAAFRKGTKLDDPKLYREKPLGTFALGGER